LSQDGWACWAFSNHDVERHASRWELSDAAQRLHAALLMSLRGSVCLYQGEELGLTEAYVAFEDLQDPYGIRFWPKFKGRDGCRTPMVWRQDNQNGGFSEAKPWLPVAMEHLQSAAESQAQDPSSMLAFYRKMLAFRATCPELAKGTVEIIEATEGVISFTRTLGTSRVFCAFNLSDVPHKIARPVGRWTELNDAPFQGGDTVLPAWQAVFAREEG
ncbi:MAG: alpha-amylase family glycosyl hydrolase, partial [Pseudomonadota bacterium]